MTPTPVEICGRNPTMEAGDVSCDPALCARTISGNDGSDPTHIVDLQYHNWGQALSCVFADHRHVTLGYNRYVAAGPPYQVVKTAGLNLPTFHYLYVCAKPD